MQEDKPTYKILSSFIGKLLRDSFGKGPEAVWVSIGYTYITMYIRNFISPSEKVLLDQDQERIVDQMRYRLMQTLIPEIKAYIEVITGVKLREFYYDWNFQNRTGILIGVSSEPFPEAPQLKEQFEGRDLLNREIIKISQHAEKLPEELYSCELNPRTVLVVRNGILVRIEKELIRLGYEDILRGVKRNLEKSLLHNSSHFESIFNKRVNDVFVDWDFDLDKSVIVFMLNPKRPLQESIQETVNIE